MIKKEWKSLCHNKIMLLVVFAIILIPIIYAGFFLKSMWDPYGSLDNLPVAVVNNDKPVEYEDKTLHVGNDMVKEMRDDESLAFNFVDAQVAEDGLRNGTFYMIITIPEDFSKNASTLMDDEPKKMELQYETNPGTNYIASKMSETALTKIRDSVASKVTKVYTESVFAAITDAGDGMKKAADGSGDLKDGIVDASDGNEKITKNLKTLSSSTLTFKDGAQTLTKGLKDYTDGVSQVNSGAKELRDGVATLADSVPQMTLGTAQLNAGAKEYTAGVATLNSNSSTLTAGTKELNEGAQSLKTGTKTLKSGTSQYVAGVNTLADGVVSYVGGAEQLAAGVSQLYTGVAVGSGDTPSLVSGTQQLEDGLNQMYTQVTALSNVTSAEGLATLTKGLKEAKTGMDEAAAGMDAAAIGIDSAAVTVGKVSTQMSGELVPALQQVSTGVTDVITNASNLLNNCAVEASYKIDTANTTISTGQGTMTDAAAQLSALQTKGDAITADDLTAVINSLNSGAQNMTQVEAFETATYQGAMKNISDAATTQFSALNDKLNQAVEAYEAVATGLSLGAVELTAGAEAMQDGAKQMEAGASQIPSNIPDNPLPVMQAALKQLYDGAKTVNTATGTVAEGLKTVNTGFTTLTANDTTLKNGASELKKSGKTLTSGTTELADGATKLASGTSSLNSGVKEYTAGVAKLNSNSKTLTDGTQKLADGARTLGSGASQLRSGTISLYDGTSQLTANNQTLNSGASQLADGAGQIQDGSQQLYEGSEELGNGMKKLKNGSTTLSDSLADGADQVKTLKTGDTTVNMFAEPVKEEETKMTEVPNNGHAMAPYMMSVALWVGALAFCLLYPLTKYNGKLKSGLSWWASKATVLFSVAILQALVLIGLLHKINGFTPAEMGKTVLFACITAMTFTSIMYFFNSTFGKVGSFLMLVFMVIQLAGSAGTYPVEISPPFVAAIHKYLPFTYTVEAFRSTICGGVDITHEIMVMIGIFLVFTGLTILEFYHKAKAVQAGKHVLYDWMEEHGLA